MNSTNETCVFCDAPAKILALDDVTCQHCGKYRFYPRYRRAFEASNDRHLIAGYIRHQNLFHHRVPIFDRPEKIETARRLAPKTIAEKAWRLLAALARKSQFFGDLIPLTWMDRPLAYCRSNLELSAYVNHCAEREWINISSLDAHLSVHLEGDNIAPARVFVTAKGYEELERHERSGSESPIAFVAMWYSDDMLSACNAAIRPAIEACGFEPVVCIQKEFLGSVIDEMLGDIRRSRFLVAEFTGHRNGVYFEAGFALGLGIPVIWVVKSSELDNAHFDTSHFNHITWDNHDDLAKRLSARIKAVVGYGPRKATS